ncbi:hypothetical protein ACFOD4_05815 [Pseudoroseomonas globiformis]|uniref:DUF4412 domain-containing protein n=1 Tax=Teichococcus globiformis TaxID=2307229 RepID=A0ABV7FW15_9PROT
MQPITVLRGRRSAFRLGASLVAVCAVALPGPAEAQASPQNLRPVRDVAVTYDVRVGQRPARQVPVSWQAATQRVRAEPPGLPGWILVALPEGRAQMVMDAAGMVVDLPAGDMAPFLGGVPPGTRLIRQGEATIAGQRCTDWRVTRKDGEGTVCLTTDGVVLRAEGRHKGQEGRIEALTVSYATQPDGRFSVPAGYRPLALPPALLSGLLGGG